MQPDWGYKRSTQQQLLWQSHNLAARVNIQYVFYPYIAFWQVFPFLLYLLPFFTRAYVEHIYLTIYSRKLEMSTAMLLDTNVLVTKYAASTKSIRFKGVFLWNIMSSKLEMNPRMSCYPHSLKSYLITNDVPLTLLQQRCSQYIGFM